MKHLSSVILRTMRLLHFRNLTKPLILTVTFVCGLVFSQTTFAEVQTSTLTLNPKRILTHKLTTPSSGIAATIANRQSSVEIQVLEENKWSAWRPLVSDNDAFPWEKHSQLIFTDNAESVRLRSNESTAVTLHAISTEQDPVGWEEAAGRKLSPAAVIIPRWQWGADESLRRSKRGVNEMARIFDANDPFLADRIRNCDRRAFLYPDEFTEVGRKFASEDGTALTWPVGYSKDVNLFVVHHTAESTTAARRHSDTERMRTIYQYHALSRGWGDVGYNFLVGPNGTIFEGRAGGDYAVGAHAYCNNVGSIGVSLMGNFQTGKPTDEQLTALRWLLVYLADKYDVDPNERTTHHGKLIPSIVGHRDVGQTACPGVYSHELLPQIRLATANQEINTPLFSSVASASSQNEAALMESLLPVSVVMGSRDQIEVKYMNVGIDTWNEKTWLLGKGDEGLYFTQYLPYSFVAGFLKEQEVRPGEIGTFVVKLQGGLSQLNGNITFTPVINNDRRLINNTTTLTFNTGQASPRFTHVTSYFPPLHKTGEDLTGTTKIINSGTVPWERGTITELEFDVAGGGDISILNHPDIVAPGEQGAFKIRFHNVDEEGEYNRTLTPRFAEGSMLVGGAIEVASRAEPIPDVAFQSTHLAASSGFTPARAGRLTKFADVMIEALAGTQLTLSPREQASIPMRIRAGKSGVARFQSIAPIVRSSPMIVLRDQKSTRMRNTFRSPIALRKFQTDDFELLIIAPRNEGHYTFSIGDISFNLVVSATGRYTIRKSTPVKKLTRRGSQQALVQQRKERRSRRTRLAPPVIRKKEDAYIRIRLTYNENNAILDSPVKLRIDGDPTRNRYVTESDGSTIFTDGPAHLNIQDNFCHIATSDGQLRSPVLRFTPQEDNASTTIVTMNKSANRFRGTLECRVIDGKLTLINDLPLEEYLAGLAEEPDSEPYEKQRAFAIAARSYALWYIVSSQKKFAGMPFDGSDSPKEFQAYGGSHFEELNPQWVEAVRNTKNKVISWQRKLIKPPYFSTDDGYTKSASDVWGWTNTPYLDAKPDPWCKGLSNWGHGVGMSGCGAEGQALEGKTGEEIIRYYYGNSNVVTWDPEKYTP